MTRLVVKVGGAVASRSAEAGRSTSRAALTRSASCTAPGRRSRPRWSAPGIPVEFVGGRRVTTPDGLEVVRASFAAVNAALCAAIGERAVPLFGDEIGLDARARSRSSGSSATRCRAAPAAIEAALAAGRSPSSRRSRAAR